MLIGYTRVSSVGQSLDVQIAALTASGCDKVYSEKRSGRTARDRPELARALDQLRPGDQLVVTRLDRLARSVGDLHALVEQINASGAGFRCLQQGGVDTTTSTGKLMLAILGAVAEFENDIRRERQRDGIEKAKAAGVYRGRPQTIDQQHILQLIASGLGPSAVARKLGISRASVYRLAPRVSNIGQSGGERVGGAARTPNLSIPSNSAIGFSGTVAASDLSNIVGECPEFISSV